MVKFLKSILKLFKSDSHLPEVINKARIFNSWEMLWEILTLLINYFVSLRTNQSDLLYICLFVNGMMAFGNLSIHVQVRVSHFLNCLGINLLSHLASIILLVFILLRFFATYNMCKIIQEYYDKVEDSSNCETECQNVMIYYGVWILLIIICTIARIFGFVYDYKGYKFSRRVTNERRKKQRIKEEHRLKQEKKRKARMRRFLPEDQIDLR